MHDKKYLNYELSFEITCEIMQLPGAVENVALLKNAQSA